MASNLQNSKGMRWPREVISMAITLYNRNPSAYRDVTKNGWLHLPSEQLLSLYKNAVCQGPGIIPQMMEWMLNEAQRQNLTQIGYFGGLILDEMSIQEDIQIVHYKSSSSLVGLTDSGPEIKTMHAVSMGKAESKMAMCCNTSFMVPIKPFITQITLDPKLTLGIMTSIYRAN
ncbi:hypothetical protein ACJMK2_028215 [Sinanodonta woodiana]|uniref:Transposable element P transposase-like RNase H domain-containing protein n=1 Tax=Sinanodonta woodiana TaxID=1069815 RepID=A0ABD3X8M3_SINWO